MAKNQRTRSTGESVNSAFDARGRILRMMLASLQDEVRLGGTVVDEYVHLLNAI